VLPLICGHPRQKVSVLAIAFNVSCIFGFPTIRRTTVAGISAISLSYLVRFWFRWASLLSFSRGALAAKRLLDYIAAEQRANFWILRPSARSHTGFHADVQDRSRKHNFLAPSKSMGHGSRRTFASNMPSFTVLQSKFLNFRRLGVILSISAFRCGARAGL
jgi:hypothetical protein